MLVHRLRNDCVLERVVHVLALVVRVVFVFRVLPVPWEAVQPSPVPQERQMTSVRQEASSVALRMVSVRVIVPPSIVIALS